MGSDEYAERNIKGGGYGIPWTRVLFCEIYESGTNVIICITYTNYVRRWRNPRSSARPFERNIIYNRRVQGRLRKGHKKYILQEKTVYSELVLNI